MANEAVDWAPRGSRVVESPFSLLGYADFAKKASGRRPWSLCGEYDATSMPLRDLARSTQAAYPNGQGTTPHFSLKIPSGWNTFFYNIAASRLF